MDLPAEPTITLKTSSTGIDNCSNITARFRFDINGDRVRAQTTTEPDAACQRIGVGAVRVPASSSHEMNNVRADGKDCRVKRIDAVPTAAMAVTRWRELATKHARSGRLVVR